MWIFFVCVSVWRGRGGGGGGFGCGAEGMLRCCPTIKILGAGPLPPAPSVPTPMTVNPFEDIMQTVQTQFRRSRTRRLIRVYTVCIQKYVCKISLECSNSPENAKTRLIETSPLVRHRRRKV